MTSLTWQSLFLLILCDKLFNLFIFIDVILEMAMTQGWLEENLLKRRKKNRLTSPLKSLIRDTSP
jgi:hypothetical protein